MNESEDAHVDVLVLTAVQDELEAVLAVRDAAGAEWQELRDRGGFRYHRREFRHASGSFTVAAAWVGEMGGRAAAIRAPQLLTELSPSCLAMCGICAGDPNKVALGDIIVADRLFAWDEGKRIAEPGKEEEFYHALRTFDLEATWRMDAAFLAGEIDPVRLSKDRPPSKNAQRNWFLHTLSAFEAGQGQAPEAHPDRKQRCPSWTVVFDGLLSEGLIALADNGALLLTAEGRKVVARDKMRHPDGLPPDPPLRVHVGAMATVAAVIEDPSIFKRMQHVVRSTLGLEMEGAAVGEVAQRFKKRAILVKAVQDFADGTKDDSFRAFGCRAAAEFLFAFLEKHFEPERDDRHRDKRIELREFDREREHPFLAKVERIAAIRFPEAKITKHHVDAPFAGVLELDIEKGGYSGTQLVAALDQPITSEIVQRFATIERPFRDNYPALRSTIVHQGDVAPRELRADARRRGIHLETFHSYQGLFDLTPYLEKQTFRLEKDQVYPPAMYVDPPATYEVQGSRERTQVDNALRYLLELLESSDQRRFALVIGEFGAGKTFLLHELARRMVVDKHPVWPVLVEMHHLEKQPDLSALLAAHFANADVPGYNFKAFQYMLNEGRIALLFDGFDELAGQVTYDAVNAHFDTVLSAAQGERAKVVLSSRRQHFLSETQIKLGLTERAEKVTGYRLVMLARFEELQIRQYLRNALEDPTRADERYALIRDVQDLLGLSHNPRMLGFIARIPEASLREAKREQGTITAAGLYELLVKEWLDFEHERSLRISTLQGISRGALDKGVTALALSMWHARTECATVDQIRDVFSNAMCALGEPPLDPNVIAHLFGSGSLLVRDAEGQFSFVHRSVMEWLVARVGAQVLERGGDPASLDVGEISPLMADFFYSMATREKAIAWSRSKLLARQKGTVRKNATLVLQRLGATFERLDFAGHDLRGQDFSSVDWRGADLRGANLEGATLVGANLSNANLVGARLYRANLERANLNRARLDTADLHVARLLRADLTSAEGLESAELFRTNFAGATLPDSFDPAKADLVGAPSVLRQPEPMWAGAAAAGCSVAFDGTGELLAAGFADGTVRIFDAVSGELVRVLAGHANSIRSVAFSPDGKTIASGSYDETLRLWDVASGRSLRALEGHTSSVRSVAFSPDGKTIASGSDDNKLRLWDVASGRALRVLGGHTKSVRSVAFSPDGKTIASGSSDNTLRLWDVASRRALRALEGHTNSVRSVAFSPDSKMVASGSYDKTVRLWDTSSGRSLCALEGHTNSVRSVSFSPDSKTIASGSDDTTLRVWDVASGRSLRALEGHSNGVVSVSFSPDGKTIASASEDTTLRVWDVASGRSLRALEGHTNSVRSVAFSPDGKTIASGSDDKTVRIWDVTSGRPERTLYGHTRGVLSVAFSPNGKTVALGSHDNTVHLRNFSSGPPLRSLSGHANSVNSVAFSPDGKTIASGSEDKTVRLWDVILIYGRLLRSLEGHANSVWSVVFSPDSKTLASGSDDKTIRLWDSIAGRCLRVFEGHANWVRSVAFSPKGKTIASGSYDNTLRLWDVASGRSIGVLEGHTNGVLSVAFSPDGKTIASGSSDNTIRLWDVTSARCLRVLEGHSNAVTSVVFSPNGKTLASGSSDNTIRLWDVASRQCLAILFATADGWVAFTPDGHYKFGGNLGGSFWHVVNLCRFEVGEIDEFLPHLRLPDDAPLTPNT